MKFGHREGFALPMAILVVMITAGAVITTLNQSSSERRVVDSEQAGNMALAMAETALEQVPTQWQAWGFAAPPDATLDSTRVNFPEGYADVIWQRIRPASADNAAVYVVRSRGVYTRRAWGGATSATRVVTRFANWQTASIDAKAAWTSITGLTKNGGAGTIDGADACGVKGPVAGVAVPGDPGYSQNGGTPVPTGNPPILHLGANPGQAKDSVHVDWNAIVNGGAIPFDIVIPPGTWPDFSDPNYWPVIYVDNPGGNITLPGNGRGILIVRGSLAINGSRSWDGIVLVGQVLTSNGNNIVEGTVISGLNQQLGLSVGESEIGVSDLGNGTKTFRFNSCKIGSALGGFSQMRVLSNTWFDGWALY
jgi:hypothetical protein